MKMIVTNNCYHEGRYYVKDSIAELRTVPNRHFKPLDPLSGAYAEWAVLENVWRSKIGQPLVRIPDPAVEPSTETPAPQVEQQAPVAYRPATRKFGKK